MNNTNFTAVIFDLDGTLLYTLDDIAENVNLALMHFSYPTHENEKVKTFINNGAFKLIQRALPENVRSDTERVTEVLDYYNGIYAQNVAVKTTPYKGIPKLISTLKSRGIALAVASNKPLLHTTLLCEHFFGKQTFSYIYGSGDNRPTKPSKEVADIVLGAINKSPDEILYVGDSAVDVKFARACSFFCVGVSWGFKGNESFIEEKPNILVDTPEKIFDLI